MSSGNNLQSSKLSSNICDVGVHFHFKNLSAITYDDHSFFQYRENILTGLEYAEECYKIYYQNEPLVKKLLDSCILDATAFKLDYKLRGSASKDCVDYFLAAFDPRKCNTCSIQNPSGTVTCTGCGSNDLVTLPKKKMFTPRTAGVTRTVLSKVPTAVVDILGGGSFSSKNEYVSIPGKPIFKVPTSRENLTSIWETHLETFDIYDGICQHISGDFQYCIVAQCEFRNLNIIEGEGHKAFAYLRVCKEVIEQVLPLGTITPWLGGTQNFCDCYRFKDTRTHSQK